MSESPSAPARSKRGRNDPRKFPASGGYPPGQPTPDRVPPKAPGSGSPHEHQNVPDQKPGKGNS
jgi:hypothetical protein